MARKAAKKRLFSGMTYREVQRSNSNRRGQLPRLEQKLLKEKGYKNMGWDNVVSLYQKINALLADVDSDESTLEELFLKADQIGNKYQTTEEVKAFNQALRNEAEAIADAIDQQFPEPEFEFTDYSQPTRSRAKKPTKRRQR